MSCRIRSAIPVEAPFRGTVRRPSMPDELALAPRLASTFEPGRPEARHALLILPFYPKDPHSSFGKHVLTPSLSLATIAAATPPAWTVKLWDENLLNGPPPTDPIPQVVGITVHLTFAERAYELARHYRSRGALVVLGGLHLSACPEEAAPHADVIAIGNGATLWPQILEDVGRGVHKSVYRADFGRLLELEPEPRRDLLPRHSFLTTTSVNATRGCHSRCGFCYLSTRGVRMPYQNKPPAQVAREIARDGQPYAVFTDNNLCSSQGYLYELCSALAPLQIIWSAAVSIEVTDDPKLVSAMALSGCTGVFVGFESLTDENLRAAKKKTPRAADYGRRVQIFHDNGIQVNGSFVLGFDHDRRDVFAETAMWIEDNRLECATFHILTPYPGTPLFRQMEAESRLLHKDWSRYDTAHVVFRPKQMSPDELYQGYAWLYRRTFSLSSIWRRRPADPGSVLPYLAMSCLYKRSNAIWHFLIRHDLTHSVWAPLVEASRRRHLHFRKGLAAGLSPGSLPHLRALARREAVVSSQPSGTKKHIKDTQGIEASLASGTY